jgi:hypothetical protein
MKEMGNGMSKNRGFSAMLIPTIIMNLITK